MKSHPFHLTPYVLLLTLIFVSVAGAGWVRQPSNTTLKLWDVCFVDSLYGWSVGGKSGPSDTSLGFCLRTTDGGLQWSKAYEIRTWGILTTVSFVSRTHGWMMSDSSLSLVTTDGGLTWQNLPQISFWFVSFAQRFVNDTLGYVVGGTPLGGMLDGTAIYRTADGGASWVAVVPYKRGQWLLGLDIRASNWVWTAGGYDTLFRTTNAGATWQRLNFPAQTPGFYGLAFGDTNTGVAASYRPTLFRTSDGGNTWTESPCPTTRNLYSAEMSDPLNAWACGSGGAIVASTDGGINWSTQVSGTGAVLRKIWFVNARQGWAVGDSGVILYTNDGGRSGVDMDVPMTRTGRVEIRCNPNPSRGPVEIKFSLPSEGSAELSVYDLTGRRIRKLTEGIFSSGTSRIIWDGRDERDQGLSEGVYFVRFESKELATTQKVILVK